MALRCEKAGLRAVNKFADSKVNINRIVRRHNNKAHHTNYTKRVSKQIIKDGISTVQGNRLSLFHRCGHHALCMEALERLLLATDKTQRLSKSRTYFPPGLGSGMDGEARLQSGAYFQWTPDNTLLLGSMSVGLNILICHLSIDI